MEILFPQPKPIGAKRRLLIKARVWKKQAWAVNYGDFHFDPSWGVRITY